MCGGFSGRPEIDEIAARYTHTDEIRVELKIHSHERVTGRCRAIIMRPDGGDTYDLG